MSREPPDCGKKGDPDHFLEILEILENLETSENLEIRSVKRPLS